MKRLKELSDHIVNGILAAAGLLAFYFLVLRLTNPSWDHAIEQFLKLWVWLLLLDLGFGIQVGLYTYLRDLGRGQAASRIASASAGISGGSMIACCAHHLVDVLPVVGFSGAAIFLADYQVWFIALGIISNTFGIVYMLKHIRTLTFFKGKAAKIYLIGKGVVLDG